MEELQDTAKGSGIDNGQQATQSQKLKKRKPKERQEPTAH